MSDAVLDSNTIGGRFAYMCDNIVLLSTDAKDDKVKRMSPERTRFAQGDGAEPRLGRGA